ncbi:MAG: hypothetical protein RLZZ210_386 [Pseudomonadota bacterium]
MLLLDKKWYRDLLSIKGRIIALILIIACGVGIFFGIGQAFSNLLGTQDKSIEKMKFADVEVRLLPEDLYNLPDLSKIQGVEEVEKRLMLPADIKLADNKNLDGLVLFGQTNNPSLNQIQIQEGRKFNIGTKEVVIDKALAKYHNYKLGDIIKVNIGEAKYDFTIVGIANSAEFIITAANPDYVIARAGSLGVIWADIQHVSKSLGFTMVNSLLFKIKNPKDISNITNELKRFNIERVIPKSEAYSYKMIKLNISALSVYTPAIVITLCILSIAMGFLTFKRFILEKQKEIGVLLALGITRSNILKSLLRIAFFVGSLGSLVGLVIGWILGFAFAEVYAKAMHLAVVFHQFDFILAIQSIGIGLLSSIITMYLAANPLLKKLPVHLINFRDSSLANQIAQQKISSNQSLLSNKNLLKTYAMRNVIRDKISSIASIFAMAGSISVAIAYSLAMHSTFSTVEHGFVQEKWSHAIDFDYALYEDDAKEVLKRNNIALEQAEPYYRSSADIYAKNGNHVVALLAGIAIPSKMRKIEISEGKLPNNENEGVLSSDLARQLKIKLGDIVSVEKGQEKRDIKIVALTSNMFLYTLTIPVQTAQALGLAQEKISGYYLNSDDKTVSKLIDDKSVARITNKQQLVSFFDEEMTKKMGLVYITIIFSLGVSILFVSTLICLSILERRQEYTILRALGFHIKTLQNIIFTSTFVQVLSALVLSVPMSLIVVYFLNQRMTLAWFSVDLYTNFSSFIYPMLAIFVISPVVAYLSTKHILNINIPDFLRERSI